MLTTSFGAKIDVPFLVAKKWCKLIKVNARKRPLPEDTGGLESKSKSHWYKEQGQKNLVDADYAARAPCP